MKSKALKIHLIKHSKIQLYYYDSKYDSFASPPCLIYNLLCDTEHIPSAFHALKPLIISSCWWLELVMSV